MDHIEAVILTARDRKANIVQPIPQLPVPRRGVKRWGSRRPST